MYTFILVYYAYTYVYVLLAVRLGIELLALLYGRTRRPIYTRLFETTVGLALLFVLLTHVHYV